VLDWGKQMRPNQPSRSVALGSLHTDLERIAAKAARLCAGYPLTVWVDHTDQVYVDPPMEVLDAPRDYIVGTYSGDTHAIIEKLTRDLGEMKRRHGKVR
jgi:hypothetical protein